MAAKEAMSLEELDPLQPLLRLRRQLGGRDLEAHCGVQHRPSTAPSKWGRVCRWSLCCVRGISLPRALPRGGCDARTFRALTRPGEKAEGYLTSLQILIKCALSFQNPFVPLLSVLPFNSPVKWDSVSTLQDYSGFLDGWRIGVLLRPTW